MRQPLRQAQPDGPDEVGLTRQRLDGAREHTGGKLRDVRRVARQYGAMQGRRAAARPGRIGDERQIDEADRPAERLERSRSTSTKGSSRPQTRSTVPTAESARSEWTMR